MEFKIRAIEFNYDHTNEDITEITIRYDSNTGEGVYVNGAVKITNEEYEASLGDLKNIASLAKSKLSNLLTDGE